MKTSKKLMLALGVLCAVFLVISLILPGVIIIEKEKTFNAAPSTVFNLVKETGKWSEWNPVKWEVAITRTATDTILAEVKTNDAERLPMGFYFTQLDSGVKVKWRLKRKVGFFSRIFPGLFLEKKQGRLLEQGLKALDSLVRTIPTEGIQGITAFERRNVLCLKDSCAERDLAFVVSKLYGEIQRNFDDDTKILGAPLCIFHSFSEEKVVLEAAISVEKVPSSISNPSITVKNISIPRALVYNYFGSTFEIKRGYAAIAEYIQKNRLVQNGSSIEEYVSDTMKETAASKWLTRIYVPVE